MLTFACLTTAEKYMSRCLQLAALGLGKVSPNPMVGAVLVYQDKIIGEGYHEQFGSAHAEVNCFKSVKEADKAYIPESTLYVSLEPCCHHGKTPPCTDLIINQGIKKVVVATEDPFEKVSGGGIEKLRNGSIEVMVDVLKEEAQQLNHIFFHFHRTKRPYIILKWAQTANGMMAAADNARLFISGELTNKLVHRWRSETDAIMVGTNTALFDNPSLTTRHWPGKNPVRVVLDLNLKVNKYNNLLDDSTPTIVINATKEVQVGQTTFVRVDPKKNLLQQLNEIFYKRGISSLLVEGGSMLLQTFIKENIWEEMRVITNPNLIVEKGISAPQHLPIDFTNQFEMGQDLISIYHNSKK